MGTSAHGRAVLTVWAYSFNGWLIGVVMLQGDGGPLEEPARDGGCAYYYIGADNRFVGCARPMRPRLTPHTLLEQSSTV